MSETVLLEVDGSVGIMTLNRPERRNALTFEMRDRMREGLATFDANDDVRVVVLEGAAPTFCAGVDLSLSGDTSNDIPAERQESVSAPIAAFGKPIIASVIGAAAGGGFELALACDFIVASATSKFLLPEVRIGSLPGGGGTQRLVRSIPRGVAARLLLTGDSLNAQDALACGLVTELVEADLLHDRSMAIAHQIAANAPLSLAAIKQCLNAAASLSLDDGLTFERSLWAKLATTEDRAEGRQAFRENRPPKFKGK